MALTSTRSDQPSTRVVLADDHPLFRDALRLVLEAEGGFSIVGEAGNGEEALQVVRETDPDLLLLDLRMPRLGGLDTLRALRAMSSAVRTVLLTGEVVPSEALDAVKSGARGLLLKTAPPPVLFDCLHSVMKGGLWFDTDLVQALTGASGGAARPTPRESLTPRELQIVAAVVDGSSNHDIGLTLGISAQTVKNHLHQVFDKLGVSSRLELALQAMHHNLVAARHAGAEMLTACHADARREPQVAVATLQAAVARSREAHRPVARERAECAG
jgi:two-component system, NarL family, nitrate/nitrite response regulator NarL